MLRSYKCKSTHRRVLTNIYFEGQARKVYNERNKSLEAPAIEMSSFFIRRCVIGLQPIKTIFTACEIIFS